MYIVAIHNLKEDKQNRAGELSAVLRVTNLEALSRLRAPESGPFVLGVFAGKEEAEGLKGRLISSGFDVLMLGPGEIEAEADQRLVRKFELGEQALSAGTSAWENLAIPYRDVDLIVRGIGISSSTSMETREERKFDLATAVVSSGLKVMKTVKTVHQVTKEEREGFFNLYAGAGPILAFHENGVVYDGLGPSRTLSRSSNFLQVIAELRKRCPGARYDDRLLNRARASALLGPRLDPEEPLVIATALLAKTLRGKT